MYKYEVGDLIEIVKENRGYLILGAFRKYTSWSVHDALYYKLLDLQDGSIIDISCHTIESFTSKAV